MKPRALAVVAFALALTLSPLGAVPARASTAGWDVEWVRSPATNGPSERLSTEGGRVVYLAGDGAVVLYDAENGAATTLTGPGVAAGAPAIEGDYVVWPAFPWAGGDEGLFLRKLSTGENRTIAAGHIYGKPQLRGGRILWSGGTNEQVVLNLYDIATGTNTPLNEGTFGQNLALLLNDRWVVWRESQPDGHLVLFAYDIAAAVKHTFSEGTDRRRMYALIGDQVVLSHGDVPEDSGIVGLALFDLRQGTFTGISSAGDSSIAYVAADESAGRLAFTAYDVQGAYAAIYDLASRSTERVPSPHYSLGPVEIAGDIALFRGQPHEGIFSGAPMVLFAYRIDDHTLTDLGQLMQDSFPFTTDGTRAYWIAQVMMDGSPHLPPHWEVDLITLPSSSEHLFTATPPGSTLDPFVDVPGTHPYRTAIVSLFDQGAVAGYEIPGGAAFRPDEPYLRAQFAKVMVEALGLPVDEELQAPFWDLGPDDPDSLYPHDYIAAAYKAGLIKGYPEGRFRPWEPISRAQLATLVVRAASSLPLGMLLTPPGSYSSLLGDFDRTHGANLRVAQYNGLVNSVVGYGYQWDPWPAATRAEGAQMLWNLLRIDVGEGIVPWGG